MVLWVRTNKNMAALVAEGKLTVSKDGGFILQRSFDPFHMDFEEGWTAEWLFPSWLLILIGKGLWLHLLLISRSTTRLYFDSRIFCKSFLNSNNMTMTWVTEKDNLHASIFLLQRTRIAFISPSFLSTSEADDLSSIQDCRSCQVVSLCPGGEQGNCDWLCLLPEHPGRDPDYDGQRDYYGQWVRASIFARQPGDFWIGTSPQEEPLVSWCDGAVDRRNGERAQCSSDVCFFRCCPDLGLLCLQPAVDSNAREQKRLVALADIADRILAWWSCPFHASFGQLLAGWCVIPAFPPHSWKGNVDGGALLHECFPYWSQADPTFRRPSRNQSFWYAEAEGDVGGMRDFFDHGFGEQEGAIEEDQAEVRGETGRRVSCWERACCELKAAALCDRTLTDMLVQAGSFAFCSLLS